MLQRQYSLMLPIRHYYYELLELLIPIFCSLDVLSLLILGLWVFFSLYFLEGKKKSGEGRGLRRLFSRLSPTPFWK